MRLLFGVILLCLSLHSQAEESRLASLFAADAHPATATEQVAACETSRDHWATLHAHGTVLVSAEPICDCEPVRALDLSRCEAGTESCELSFVDGFTCTFLGPVETASALPRAGD